MDPKVSPPSRGLAFAAALIAALVGLFIMAVALLGTMFADGPKCYMHGCDKRGTNPVQFCEDHYK